MAPSVQTEVWSEPFIYTGELSFQWTLKCMHGAGHFVSLKYSQYLQVSSKAPCTDCADPRIFSTLPDIIRPSVSGKLAAEPEWDLERRASGYVRSVIWRNEGLKHLSPRTSLYIRLIRKPYGPSGAVALVSRDIGVVFKGLLMRNGPIIVIDPSPKYQ